jgi:hypothetical protein
MGIKADFSMRDIDKVLQEEAQRADMLTIRALSYLGEMCVAKIRTGEVSSWNDQTGNLRSSIGYVIVQDGKIKSLKGFTGNSEGISTGEELAKKLAAQYASPYALIVVAGMNYAELVEARDNKVVLAGAELFARQQLPAMLAKLEKQIAG